jgi:hypothetical protein
LAAVTDGFLPTRDIHDVKSCDWLRPASVLSPPSTYSPQQILG